MGKHYLLNLYGCSYAHLNDVYFLIDLLGNAAVASGATVCQTIHKKFEPQGCTVLCLLSESHISIHTWPEKKYAAMDIFMCGNSKPQLTIPVIKAAFKTWDVKVTQLCRGKIMIDS